LGNYLRVNFAGAAPGPVADIAVSVLNIGQEFIRCGSHFVSPFLYRCQGPRPGRLSNRLASSSLRTRSCTGSHSNLRPTAKDRLPRIHKCATRTPASMFMMGFSRDLMQSSKFSPWPGLRNTCTPPQGTWYCLALSSVLVP